MRVYKSMKEISEIKKNLYESATLGYEWLVLLYKKSCPFFRKCSFDLTILNGS